MDFFLLFLPLLTISLAFRTEPLTNPLYISKFPQAMLQTHTHVFISKIDLQPLNSAFNETLQAALKLKPISPPLMQLLHLCQIEMNKFNLVKREKRGLFNFVGKIHKTLFGTVDEDDLDVINAKFNVLLKNEQDLTLQVNNRMSILQTLSAELNATLEQITRNSYLTSAYPLHDRAHQLHTTLRSLNEAITLSHFGIATPDLIDQPTIAEIYRKLYRLYPTQAIPRFRQSYSFFQLITANVKIFNNAVIISISFPIVKINRFNLVHLIPIPINYTILHPPQPYVLFDQQGLRWMSSNCPIIEEQPICKTSPAYSKDTCFYNILLERPPTCSLVQLTFNHTFVDTINNHVLIIPTSKDQPSVTEDCSQGSTTKYISTPTLITMDECPLTINDDKFFPSTNLQTQTLLLPLQMDTFEISHKAQTDLTGASLRDVIQQLNEIKPISMPKSLENVTPASPFNYFFLLLGIPCCVLGYFAYTRCGRTHHQPPNISIKLTKEPPPDKPTDGPEILASPPEDIPALRIPF